MNKHYQITVEGSLGPSWSEWLSGMIITESIDPDSHIFTTISGEITDQAQLRGIMTKLWDLNLVIISVELIATEQDKREI